MKFSLSIFSLCLSAVLAVRNDCLDADRSNLASVCRNECAQEGAVAFSVSHDDIWCRCYPDTGELGTYTGNGNRNFGMACYSMADGEETQFLDYGRCVIDSSTGGYGTRYTMQWCRDGEEKQQNCLDEERKNIETVCHEECMKHESVAFAVSNEDDDDAICRCYPPIENDEYTGSGELVPDSKLTCFPMQRELVFYSDMAFGDCVPSNIYMSHGITEHTMKICPQDEKLLRGS